MGKKPTKSKKSVSASNTEKMADKKMKMLKLKSPEKMKRVATRSQSKASEGKEMKPSSPNKPKTKTKKITKREDAKKPKKPPTAFFYYLEDFRKEYQEQNPDVKSMRDIGKACGEKWKTMTYEEKVQYYDIATEKRAEFDQATAEYIKRKESGEDHGSEEDSDFD